MPTSSHASIANVQREVRELLPSLSRAQANVLGEMAYAMLMTDGCGMTRMSSYMAELLGQPMNTLETKISGDVLRKRSQSRSQKPAEKTSRDRAGGVICRSVERSPQRVGRGENAGAGPGCQRLWPIGLRCSRSV